MQQLHETQMLPGSKQLRAIWYLLTLACANLEAHLLHEYGIDQTLILDKYIHT